MVGTGRLFELATCADLYRRKRYHRARDCFEALVRRRPDSALLVFALGYCHYQLRAYRQALKWFQRAHRLSARDGDIVFMLGVTLARLGRNEEALEALRLSLELGLDGEDPEEARSLISLLRRLRDKGDGSGWRFLVALDAGYDSHPRLEGFADQAGTSLGTVSSGSAVTALDLQVGYGFQVSPRLLLSPRYRFSEWIVWRDLSSDGRRLGEPHGGASLELSLQRHRAVLTSRFQGRRWWIDAVLRADVEIAGLRRLALSYGAFGGELAAAILWHEWTSTNGGLGLQSGRALDPGLAYLDGTTLWGTVVQEISWKMLHVAIGYRFSKAWLGMMEQPAADCPARQACVLRQPFSHQAHRGFVQARFQPCSWLLVDAFGHLTWRHYEAASVLTEGGVESRSERRDFVQAYGLALSFHLWNQVDLRIRYSYRRQASFFTQMESGIEDNYSRHQVLGGVRYAL